MAGPEPTTNDWAYPGKTIGYEVVGDQVRVWERIDGEWKLVEGEDSEKFLRRVPVVFPTLPVRNRT